MEQSKDHLLQAKHAIEAVKHVTKSDKVLASVQGLLSIIPSAGGPLSFVLSEYRGRRNAQRVFDSLDALREAIEGLPLEKQNILNEDEVVEIVHDTLEEITKTSSEEKLRYLNNSLRKAFTQDQIGYSQKQFYLSILRDISIGELELIKEVYWSSDPFVVSRSPNIGMLQISEPPVYNIEFREPDSGETLREVLHRRLEHFTTAAIEGLIDSLDAKGLSRIRPNLDKRTVKIMTETYPGTIGVAITPTQTDAADLQLSEEVSAATPIEASQTDFGNEFFRYVQST